MNPEAMLLAPIALDPDADSLKLHTSEFPSSDVRNAREILTRSVSEGDTSQRF